MTKADEDSDNLVFGIVMRVSLVIVARRVAHHHDARRVVAQVHIEFLLYNFAKAFAKKLFNDFRKMRSELLMRQAEITLDRIAATRGNNGRIGKNLRFEFLRHGIGNVTPLIGLSFISILAMAFSSRYLNGALVSDMAMILYSVRRLRRVA